jgi:hypothetical protein
MDTSKIGSRADDHRRAAAAFADKVEVLARRGGHRLQETADKAKHAVEEAGLKVIHEAQETAQKGVDSAEEEVSKARHRGQERAETAA